MRDTTSEFDALRRLYPDAVLLQAGGQPFVHLPTLPIACAAGVIEHNALLCPQEHSGYRTRLFLDKQVQADPVRVRNWTDHVLFTRNWWTWSWQSVEADQPWPTILANHLESLR